jgi:hypothetical protein
MESNHLPPPRMLGQLFYRQPRGTRHVEWQGSESNRQHHEGLSFAAFPICVPCRAPPMGFEPTISCVTGRRPLRTGPRGRNNLLKRFAAILPPSGSSQQNAGGWIRTNTVLVLSETPPSVGLRRRVSDPGWTRTTVCLLVRQLLLPLSHGTNVFNSAEAEGIEPPTARGRDSFQDCVTCQCPHFQVHRFRRLVTIERLLVQSQRCFHYTTPNC